MCSCAPSPATIIPLISVIMLDKFGERGTLFCRKLLEPFSPWVTAIEGRGIEGISILKGGLSFLMLGIVILILREGRGLMGRASALIEFLSLFILILLRGGTVVLMVLFVSALVGSTLLKAFLSRLMETFETPDF